MWSDDCPFEHWRADIYSFGVVLYEVLSCYMPFGGLPFQKILKEVSLGRTPLDHRPLPADVQSGETYESLRIALSACLCHSPKQRPSMTAVSDFVDGRDDHLVVGCGSTTLDGGELPPLGRRLTDLAEGPPAGSPMRVVRVSRSQQVLDWQQVAPARPTPAQSQSSTPATSVLELGAVVQRGPTWKWKEQDGGPDRCGEVTAVDRAAGWVVVLWDAGMQNKYRIGQSHQDVQKASSDKVRQRDECVANALSAGEPLYEWHLRRTFGYKAGTTSSLFSRFDIRNDVCLAVGGFKHGQVVVKQRRIRAVTIGVKPVDGILKLWFHVRGASGAGLFDEEALSDLVASGIERVVEVRRETMDAASDDDEDNTTRQDVAANLEYTFGYPQGRTIGGLSHKLFDIRDSVCLKMAGFRHGTVVRIADHTEELVIVGIADCDDGDPRVWCHSNGDAGAGTFDKRQWAMLKSLMKPVGTRELQEVQPNDPMFQDDPYPVDIGLLEAIGEGLQCTFGYPCGVDLHTRHEWFDVRDEVCQEVGGFRHGQVVQEPGGGRSTVIGVRVDSNDNLPKLFFHSMGKEGAGIYPMYNRLRNHLTPIGTEVVRDYLPSDPIFSRR